MIERKRFCSTIDHSRCTDQRIIGCDEDKGMLCTGCLNHIGDISRLLELTVDRNEQRGDIRGDKMPTVPRSITRSRTIARLEIAVSNISLFRVDICDTSAWIQAAHRFATATRTSITRFARTFDAVSYTHLTLPTILRV